MTNFELPSSPIHAVERPPEAFTETVQLARVLWLRSLFGDTAIAEDEDRPMDAMASLMNEYFVPRGTPLYQQGSSSSSLYFIVEGCIEQGSSGYTRYISGDVLGFVDAMIGRPHANTAMVVEDAVVLRLKIDDWLDYLDEHFTALQRLILGSLRNVDSLPDQLGPNAEEICSSLCSETADNPTNDFVMLLLAARLCPLFRMASIQAIAQLIRRGQSQYLKQEEIWQGLTLSPGLCLVISGNVSLDDPLYPPETSPRIDYSPGQLIGSIRALVPYSEVVQVRANSDAHLLHIETEVFFDVMEDHFDLARSTLSYLASRVEDFNHRKPKETEN